MSLVLQNPVELILFPDTPLYTTRQLLNGVEFVLRFDWSQREDRYYLSILDALENPIRRGMKVVSNWNLTRLCRSNGRPLGMLFFSDPRTATTEPPGFHDLGRRVLLFYFEAVETPPATIVFGS